MPVGLSSLTYNSEQVFEAGPPSGQFSVSATHDGSSYTMTGRGTGAEATAVSITPEQYVTVELEGAGEIELTLPKSMIDGITMVRAGSEDINYEASESSSSTTIRFTVPDGAGSIDIYGATVVPEFDILVLLVLAASIVGVIAYTRFKADSMKLV